MPVSTPALAASFARRFDVLHGGDHGVASPLGLWLLLALVAPVAGGEQRAELEEVLGTGADDAAARATALLERPHPAVKAAAAMWSRERFLVRGALDRLAAALGPVLERGPVPTAAEADRWASERTDGLIDRFPVTFTALTALVLSSALATKVTWAEPFRDAPVADLGGDFASLASGALASPGTHAGAIARTESAGLVGVHAADAREGLRVVSVIADPGLPPAAVHAAAAEAASGAAQVSLFDLPLGDGHAWTVTERTEEVFGSRGGRSESVRSVLAPWDARSDHDLAEVAGVPAAFAALEALLDPSLLPAEFQARQAAMASYTKFGFEAAAVTVMAMAAGCAPISGTVVRRTATIRFNRPYAVVALASGSAPNVEEGWGTVDLGVPAWDGLEVFRAWVAEPS